MAKETVRLEQQTERAVRRALAKGPARPDEVVVLVLSAHGGLVSRTIVRGRPVDMRELELRLAGAEVAVEGLAKETSGAPPPLTQVEAGLLDDAGLVEGDPARPGALERSKIEFELLLKDSLTLEKAAKNLGVNASRLRQRLGQRTLYGIKDGGSWRLPRFQFASKGKKLVRGIEKVLPKVPTGAHPLAVATWFSTPHQDLVLGEDDTPVTPLEWLESGNHPTPIAELLAEI
jgi:hypothetical protein